MASIARTSLLRQATLRAPLSSVTTRSLFSSSKTATTTRSSLAPVSRVAGFHSTAARCAILPPGPQRIEGGINDPAPVPEPNSAKGSYHWTFERLLAAGLIPLSVAPFASGSLNPTLDAVLCTMVLLHSHLGFQSVIIDYIPKRTYAGLHKLFWWGLNLATLTVGVGLYEFETNDVGVTEAIKRIWKA